MKLDVNKLILRELVRQNVKVELISLIFKKLTSNDDKFIFLNFLVENRNILLIPKDYIDEIEKFN